MKTYTYSCLIALCVFALPISSSLAQLPNPTATARPSLPDPPYAIVTYPSSDATTPSVSVVSPCAGGIFSLVGLQPDQVIQVVVQYPTDQALQPVTLEALDGGIILPQANTAVVVTAVQVAGVLYRTLFGAPFPLTPQVTSLVVSA